MLLME